MNEDNVNRDNMPGCCNTGLESEPELKFKFELKSGAEFEPKIVGFLCNWCSYAGADKAGGSQKSYPPNVNVIKVMCSGRVDPQFVLKAYAAGADGVLILACHPGDCHYKEGNYRALQRHRMLLRMLNQQGIESDRCRFDYVSAGEGDRFVKILTEMVDTVRALGPMNRPGSINKIDDYSSEKRSENGYGIIGS